jgi:hypothetical protein
MDLRFWTAQKPGANLDRACAERQCGHNATTVGNSSGGDYRHSHGVCNSWNQRNKSDEPEFCAVWIECRSMSAGLHTLDDNDVGAGSFGANRFVKG